MQRIKKKIMIALLSVACAATGALGLAACNTAGSNDNGQDSALYALYLKDENKGDMSYSEWLEDKLLNLDVNDGKDGLTPHIGENGNWWIGDTDTGVPARGEDGRGIKSIIALDGEFIVIYTDGTYEYIQQSDESPVKLVKARAVDQDGTPVKGAYLKFYYYDSKNYTNVYVGKSVTDENGVAKFVYEPVKGVSYKIGLADYGLTESDPSVPEGYEITSYDFAVTGDSAVQSVEVTFKNVEDSFSNAVKHNKIITVPFTRAYDEENKKIVETDGTADDKFKVELKGDKYSYLTFLPYVKPATSEDKEETAEILKRATNAAAGKYKLSFTGGEGVTLYYYNGSQGYMPVDENGIPNIILSHSGDGTENTTANSVSLNLDTKSVRGEKIFGLYSDADCTVTLTVERTGDADEIPEPELVTVPVPSNLQQWQPGANGTTLTLMPVTGAFTAVKGSDGYWHVNGETGPVLLVQLKRAVPRFLEMSLESYPTSTDLGESVMHFNGDPSVDGDFDSSGNPLKKYDYNGVLAAYCAKANADGVYGVDDTVYTILTKLAAKGIGVDSQNTPEAYRWLLSCYFYAPEGGLPARGSGTQNDPYIAAEGSNLISLTGLDGLAYVKYTVPSAGVYIFNTQANLQFDSSVKTTKNGNLVYALFETAGEFTATLTGGDDSYKLTVSKGNTLTPVSGSDASGVDEATAISVVGTGVSGIIYNTSVIDDGVYIRFSCTPGGTGNYTLTVWGEGATIQTVGSAQAPTNSVSVYVENEIDLENNTEIKTEVTVVIKAPASAQLMLIITKN